MVNPDGIRLGVDMGPGIPWLTLGVLNFVLAVVGDPVVDTGGVELGLGTGSGEIGLSGDPSSLSVGFLIVGDGRL